MMQGTVEIKNFVDSCWRKQQRAALVLGASVNGLSWVRSLGRRGVPVLCADTYAGVASKSRFGQFVVLAPESGDVIPGEQAADRLLTHLNELGLAPIVFGTADEWQVYLARRSERPDPGFRALVPPSATMDRIADKQAQYEFASNLGIDVPPFANGRSVLEGSAAWETYPAIVKPRWSAAGRRVIGGKALFAEGKAALREHLERVEAADGANSYLVQAVIDGYDDCLYAYLGCYDADGREFSHVVKRKLRQHPPAFGDGSYDVTCDGEPITEAARRLLVGLGYRGLVGIEFKKDPATGEFAMIEINPRTVSTNQLAITAGVDFPWHAYQLIVHEEKAQRAEILESARTGRPGVHHVHEQREVRSFVRRWKAGETGLMSWLREMLGADSYALWDRGDPRPFFACLLKGIWRRLLGRRESEDASRFTGAGHAMSSLADASPNSRLTERVT